MAQFLANKEKNKVIQNKIFITFHNIQYILYRAIIETVHQRNLFELTSETTEN